MKLSNYFMITRRQIPNDEDTISAKLLIQSGMIVKNSKGIYSYLPLGFRVLENLKKIIRDEVNKINAHEVILPSLVNESNLTITQRNHIFDDEIYSLTNRNDKKLLLCPSSEELFSYLAAYKIESYKDLHFTLYQIDKKYRDEKHPEFGLIRKNEFYMFDAYSFDAEVGGLDVSYDKMYLAFKNIFNKMGINTLTVEASSSLINGISSEEFQVISDYGDNEIVKCNTCSYTCIIEDASSKSIVTSRSSNIKKKELVETNGNKSVKELSDFLNVFKSNILKSIICKIDGVYKMILLKGDSELNIKKLKSLFNTPNVEIPSIEELESININYNSVGPIDVDMEIIADNEVKSMHNFVCGSNKDGYHYINANYSIDFNINRFADLKLFDSTSLCPKCNSECKIIKGIEVGEILKIGDIYSSSYNLSYFDEKNHESFVQEGSYQIGLDRCISAIVEENHDEKGIIWPMNVSPFKVCIVVVNINDKDGLKFANSLYDKLNELNIDTLLDDRKETIGVKLNDMDLIGIPIRITIGKKLYTDDSVELKMRNEEETSNVKVKDIIKTIQSLIEINMEK